MLVYDTTATTWVKANGGMSTFSANVVSKMNQAMNNSGLAVTWRLVHAASVNYTYSGSLNADLLNLQYGSGNLAQVHAWRNTYGADVVAMLVDTGMIAGWTGQGYLLTTYGGSPDYAFSVSAIQSAELYHTLTHEVGHNMGCHHAKKQATAPGPNTALNSYSAGWYFWGTNNRRYHTIMAYDTDGTLSYTEAPLFSTPLWTYAGTVAGHAADGDNCRTIRETKDVVAAYRSGPAPTPDPNAANAVLYAYYGEYYTKKAYTAYSNYDTYGFLAYAKYYADYAHFYAYYAYVYDLTYGDDYGFSDYAAAYAYYGYIYAGYAYSYETGDEWSYNGLICEYYAYLYSYLVAAAQQR